MGFRVTVELNAPSGRTSPDNNRVVVLNNCNNVNVIGVGNHAYLKVIRHGDTMNYNMQFVIRWIVESA